MSGEHIFGKALVHSIFKIMLPYFIASFIAFGLLRYAFHRMKLDNEEGHRLEFQTREQFLKTVGLELSQPSRGPTQHGSAAKSQYDETIEMDTM